MQRVGDFPFCKFPTSLKLTWAKVQLWNAKVSAKRLESRISCGVKISRLKSFFLKRLGHYSDLIGDSPTSAFGGVRRLAFRFQSSSFSEPSSPRFCNLLCLANLREAPPNAHNSPGICTIVRTKKAVIGGLQSLGVFQLVFLSKQKIEISVINQKVKKQIQITPAHQFEASTKPALYGFCCF